MSIQTTIIPQKVDLSKSVDGSNIDYINKKLTFGKQAYNSLGLLNLRASVLEANDSITGVTNNFSDIFATNNGLLNTVNISTTTSNYDAGNKLYNNNKANFSNFQFGSYVDVAKNIYFRAKMNGISINQLRFQSANTITTVIEIKVNGVLTKTIPSQQYAKYGWYTLDIYQDLNLNDVIEINAPSGNLFFYTNSIQTNDYISYYIRAPTGATLYISYTLPAPANKQIGLNYNKSNPKFLYFMPYSSEIKADEIGDVTLSLYTGTTLLGEFNPYQIYNGLNLATTPDKAVINQADTAISKINRFVLFIE